MRAAGHSHSDVLGYTWAIFTMYLRQARITEAQRQARDLVVANRAFAGGDPARELLKSLHEAAEGKG